MRALAFTAALLLGACSASPEAATKAARGETCGGVGAIACADEADSCKLPLGACKDTTDAEGVCTQKPDVCTMEWAPVCGCDGKTYGNACAADGAGVSIASQGECPP